MPQYSGVWSLQQQMQALTSGQWATDPLFDYTTLLLQGDAGANGAQNNVFYDSSPNQFAVTRNGNTTQGTFSPFAQGPGYWGNYFDGSSLLRATASSLSSASFTVEAWVYYTGSSASNSAIYDFANTTAGYGMALSHSSAGNLSAQFYSNNTGTVIGTIASNFSGNYNTWAHIAVTYDGSTYRLFLNGLSIGTPVSSATQVVSLNSLTIGARSDASPTQAWNGYISNFRYVTGAALYTSNFTPTTSPLGIAGSGTTRLLTCQSNRFVDNSSSPYTLTVSGTPSVQAFSPFAPQFQYTASGTGGSGYFDGTGDYLSVASSSSLNPSGVNYTVDFWMYPTSYPGANCMIFEVGNASTGDMQCLLLNTGKIRFQIGGSAGSEANITLNQWQYITCVKSGTNFTVYVNAVAGTTVALTPNSKTTMFVGAQTAGANPFAGYICGFRTVSGSANVPSSVPTAPPTAITNTQLLLNFTNAGILDGTMKNNLETVGNAQVSTSVVKYGSGSMYFDGTGDYLKLPSNALYAFGTGAYTIEFWIYPSSLAAGSYHVIGANATNGIVVIISNAKVALNKYGVGDVLAYNTALTTSTWSHVAVVRESTGTNQTKIYVNGTSVATGTDSNDWTVTTNFGVGANTSDGSQAINGYLDDLRVTKGIARYTQNFIPPSVALPRQ